MTTSRDLVEECVKGDSVAREAIARGIVNYRALAQWLIRTYALDVTESSAITALRRIQPDFGDDAFEGARKILRRSYLNSRARRVALSVPNTREIQERLPSLLKAINYSTGETIRVLSFDGGFEIVIDESNLDKTLTILGEKHVEDIRRGLVELNIVMPTDCTDRPGIYALISNALALRRINIEKGWVSIRQEVVFVREEDLLDAYDALSSLTNSTPRTNEALHTALEPEAALR